MHVKHVYFWGGGVGGGGGEGWGWGGENTFVKMKCIFLFKVMHFYVKTLCIFM